MSVKVCDREKRRKRIQRMIRIMRGEEIVNNDWKPRT